MARYASVAPYTMVPFWMAVYGSLLSLDMSVGSGVATARKHNLALSRSLQAAGAFAFVPAGDSVPAAVFFFDRNGTSDVVVAVSYDDARMRGRWAECRGQVFSRFDTTCLFTCPSERMAFFSEFEPVDELE